eukprot:5549973-Alexandrium_andersonii.AAC.1
MGRSPTSCSGKSTLWLLAEGGRSGLRIDCTGPDFGGLACAAACCALGATLSCMVCSACVLCVVYSLRMLVWQ